MVREGHEGFSPSGILATPRVRDSPIWIQPRGVFRINPTPGSYMSKNYAVIIQFGFPLTTFYRPLERRKAMFTNGTCLCRRADSTIAHGNHNVWPPVRDIRDIENPSRGFDQSAMLTSYRVWGKSEINTKCYLNRNDVNHPCHADDLVLYSQTASGMNFNSLLKTGDYNLMSRRPCPCSFIQKRWE